MIIIETDTMVITKQTRFPRSKRKRIRNKWLKNPNNSITIPNPQYYVSRGVVYCHPMTAQKLRMARNLAMFGDSSSTFYGHNSFLSSFSKE